jgi:hypothetical protein
MRKIAVVGSRSFDDYFFFYQRLSEYIGDDEVVLISGGAAGADQFAEIYAHDVGLSILIHFPKWVVDNKYKRNAGFIRNKQIVDDATEMIAFWNGKSQGTKSSISLAQKKGIPVTIVNIK